jgi:sec-independent protein translocase protein TatB
MQMFGIGILELVVILVITTLVVGPDRMPALAADLARWIRRTRAYAQHLMKDFNEVMGDLEKEVGASREDWKEIASVVGFHTQDVRRELDKVAGQIEAVGAEVERSDLDGAAPPANVVPFESTRAAEEARANGAEPSLPEAEPEKPAEETPWYVPAQTSRRRGD